LVNKQALICTFNNKTFHTTQKAHHPTPTPLEFFCVVTAAQVIEWMPRTGAYHCYDLGT